MSRSRNAERATVPVSRASERAATSASSVRPVCSERANSAWRPASLGSLTSFLSNYAAHPSDVHSFPLTSRGGVQRCNKAVRMARDTVINQDFFVSHWCERQHQKNMLVFSCTAESLTETTKGGRRASRGGEVPLQTSVCLKCFVLTPSVSLFLLLPPFMDACDRVAAQLSLLRHSAAQL